jgi:hypothetical protein
MRKIIENLRGLQMSKQGNTESDKIDEKKSREAELSAMRKSAESKFNLLSRELAEAPDSMRNIVLEKIDNFLDSDNKDQEDIAEGRDGIELIDFHHYSQAMKNDNDK